MMKLLGERIRDLREQEDLSLREFAKKLGLSAAFVSDIELGRRYPSERVLAEMARILKTTVDDFRKYDRRPPVEDLKRRVSADPAFGFALRQIVDKKISAAELMKLVERERGGGKS